MEDAYEPTDPEADRSPAATPDGTPTSGLGPSADDPPTEERDDDRQPADASTPDDEGREEVAGETDRRAQERSRPRPNDDDQREDSLRAHGDRGGDPTHPGWTPSADAGSPPFPAHRPAEAEVGWPPPALPPFSLDGPLPRPADALSAAISAAFTAAAASGIVDPGGRIALIDRLARMAAQHEGLVVAHVLCLHGELTERFEDAELGHDATVAELRAALRLTRRAAERLVEDALAVDRLPRLLQAWVDGEVDRPRVRAVCDELGSVTDAEADAILDEVLPHLGSKTTGELRAWLRRLTFAADPETARRRYERALQDRRVEIRATPAGTGVLAAFDLAADDAVAVFQRIDQLARAAHDGERDIDQRRADVLVDLLLGRGDQMTTTTVELTLHADVTALAGLSDAPGELAGFGPIVADLTRRLAQVADPFGGGYRFRIHDDDLPVAVGRARRRPTARQRRTVVLRDHTCVFPGCRVPADRCDLDHRVRWVDGGATTIEQLVALCRHDHHLRHRLGWRHRPADTGDHVWTSPTGRTYTTTGRDP